MESPKNEAQRKFLKELAKNKKIPQAIIFSGASGLEKKNLALEFVKLINCQKGNLEKSCNDCFSCQLFNNNKHPDLILITPEEKDIQINQIRELQRKLSLRAQISSLKLVIIEKADSLNVQAQNCLLKTLEEPRGDSLLILICSSQENLLITIRSRCQILKFYPQEFSFQGEENFNKVSEILESSLFDKMLFAQDFMTKEISPSELDNFLKSFENYLRIVLLKEVGITNKAVNLFRLKVPKDYSILKIKKAINKISELRTLISATNVNQKLAFENLMLNL